MQAKTLAGLLANLTHNTGEIHRPDKKELQNQENYSLFKNTGFTAFTTRL